MTKLVSWLFVIVTVWFSFCNVPKKTQYKFDKNSYSAYKEERQYKNLCMKEIGLLLNKITYLKGAAVLFFWVIIQIDKALGFQKSFYELS